MAKANDIYKELSLDTKFKYEQLKFVLKVLVDSCAKHYCLLGSKRSYYDFDDGSRVVWHAGANFFEVAS